MAAHSAQQGRKSIRLARQRAATAPRFSSSAWVGGSLVGGSHGSDGAAGRERGASRPAAAAVTWRGGGFLFSRGGGVQGRECGRRSRSLSSGRERSDGRSHASD